MASKQFIDKLNEYNEWHNIPRASDYRTCPIIFENLDCSNFPVYNYVKSFVSVIFKNCDFTYSDFSTCTFLNCTFENCNFNYTTFGFNRVIECKFHSCNLIKCKIRHTDFCGEFDSNCIFYKTVFSLSCLTGSRIEADFTNACFINCELNFLNGHTESLIKHIPLICPAEGEFIGWKKAYNRTGIDKNEYIVKLLIPADAKRVSGRSSKCRCNKATVLEITTLDGSPCSDDFCVFSHYDKNFTYKKNDTLIIEDFDEDRWNECSAGIHFFMNKEEAIEY